MPVTLYKPIGKTPKELIDKYKSEHPEVKKISFAGRLDPMAHGVMILLINEECKQHDKFIGCNKTYEFQILYGFKTDTYDVLGKLLEYNNPHDLSGQINDLNIYKFIGQFNQEYPPYSSIVVNKKPLWEWAKLGLLNNINIPSKMVNIYDFEEIENDNIIESYDKLHEQIGDMINKLSEINKPNFRVDKILNLWKTFFETQKTTQIKPIIKKYRINVSSGTYIRSLSHQIGNELGCGAIALNIERTIVNH
jgi:tRNA pseudouridine55 synthase